MFQPIATRNNRLQTFLGLSAWTKYRRQLLIGLFIIVFALAYFFLPPINNTDYYTWTNGLKYTWSGQSPYGYLGYLLPPWSIPFLLPIAGASIQVWLALTVAFFVVLVVDLGKLSGILLILHPAFITLWASSNGEWLLMGPGLWLLYHWPKGYTRGIAWLLLSCKPQSTAMLLIFDGLRAVRDRDWKAMIVAATGAIGTFFLYPGFLDRMAAVHHLTNLSVLANFGIIGVIAVTVYVIAVRWNRRFDDRTLGLILSPVWTPYTLQYSYTTMIFTMRGAGLLRNAIYVTASLVLMVLFWQDYHVGEHIGGLGMVLLAALLAPAYREQKPLKTDSHIYS
jgi:hypothetical protein